MSHAPPFTTAAAFNSVRLAAAAPALSVRAPASVAGKCNSVQHSGTNSCVWRAG